jgi:hypothetical protein
MTYSPPVGVMEPAAIAGFGAVYTVCGDRSPVPRPVCTWSSGQVTRQRQTLRVLGLGRCG